jgi:hypothetical protein
MTHARLAAFLLATALTACSTGGGGTVLPSPSGDAAVSKACRAAAPDIIPSSPLTTTSLWSSEGIGSAADSLEVLRMGFVRASFTVTPTALEEASRLSAGDTSRWSKVPLTSQAGTLTLEVAPFGDPRCAAFEREVQGQRTSSDPKANTDDPMKYWTDTRFPAASPQGRNWCVAAVETSDANALKYTRTITNSGEGQSNVSVTLETLVDSGGNLVARRTLVRMYRASFPIGISQVATGCDGNVIGATPEFWGPTGIALRPASPPTLINK